MAKRASPKPARLVTIEEARKEELDHRLKRIAGQVEGLRRMLDEGRYCIEVLDQAASAQEALRGFSRAVMRNYLESCATSALRTADPREAERIYDEVLDQLFKHAR
jgi:DNA-binding FrmR family transcriptional regulator